MNPFEWSGFGTVFHYTESWPAAEIAAQELMRAAHRAGTRAAR